MKEQIQAIVTVLSLVNPTICGMMFIQDTISRLMGLIVLAMGVQFALTGVHAFAP